MQNEQLIVKYIAAQDCFLRLPNVWLTKLSSSQSEVIKLINNEIDCYFSYSRTQSSSCNSLCISARFARCLNIIEGTYVNVSTISQPPIVTSIIVSAQTEQDLEIVKLRAEKIQGIILHQINIVAKKQAIVIWISKGLHVTLIVDSIVPNFRYGKLEQHTEVHVMDTVGNAGQSSSRTEEKVETVLPTCKTDSRSEFLYNHVYRRIPSVLRVCFAPKSVDLNSNDPYNSEIESIFNIFITSTQSVKIFPDNISKEFMFSYLKLLPGYQQRDSKHSNVTRSEDFSAETPEIVVRVIIIENMINYLQQGSKEFFDEMTMLNWSNVVVSESLRKQLRLELGDKITLTPIIITEQKVTHINIFPSDESVTKEMFVNYMRENFSVKKILINSGTKITLNDQVSCEVQLLPKNCKYTLLSGETIENINICINDVQVVESSDNYPETNHEIQADPCLNICLETMQHNLAQCRSIFSMTLRSGNKPYGFICHPQNILVCGNIGRGKTTLCKIINDEMQRAPYCFYTRTMECKKLKGKKVEVINKLLVTILNDCRYHQPSILFIEDIESVTNSISEEENSPDAINAARIADGIISNVINYQSTNLINVLATCTGIDKIGDQLRSLRGVNLFQTVIKISDLSSTNRGEILKTTLLHKLNVPNEISWEYYGNKTEGWTPKDLINLAEKAAFIAWKRQIKINSEQYVLPTIDNEDLSEALNQCKPASLHGVALFSGSGHSWSDIGGLKSVKDSLVQILQWPLIYPGLFKNAPIKQQSGVLLYGMPGTGKTMIAGAIAKECGLNFINIKGPELLSKYIGASEESVRNIFHKAQCARPCVIFFDEFESLAPRRGHDSTGVTDRVVNQLLTEFDGVEDREGVAIVAATSRPDLLDPALLRPGRLDKSLLCPLPNEDEREQILEALCKKYNIDIEELNLQILARKSKNFTGADLNSILTQARMNAFEKNDENVLNEQSRTIVEIKITQNDLLVALESTQPSLNAAEIEKFNTIYKRFSKGDAFTGDVLKNVKSTLA